METIYTHLSYKERVEIRVLRKAGKSIREVSKELGRAPSTVTRELKRNEQFTGTRVIYPNHAQMKANGRRRRAYRKERLKSNRIRKYVEKRLSEGWSPELIAGRMKIEGWELRVSHEAIYQYIYDKKPGWRVYLVRHHRRRKRFGQSKRHRRSKIRNRVSLSCRPPEVNHRGEYGHWESDSVASKGNAAGLQVAVERKSRAILISRVKNRSGMETSDKLIKRLSRFPKRLRKTITYDNGSENMEHERTNKRLGTSSYFCDPNQSQQKGTVENSIGLIRRTFPKGTDFRDVSFQELKLLERKLNHRPRKCLGFQTSSEVLLTLGVALQC